jgi:hypothetical protein
MAKRLVGGGCAQVRIFSHDQAKQEAMRVEFGSLPLRLHIRDVPESLALAHASANAQPCQEIKRYLDLPMLDLADVINTEYQAPRKH